MDQAGVPDGITDEIVSLFESDLDFRRQVNPGDKIRVIFETEKVAGRDIGDYRLIAVRFEASGETYEAMRFSTADNKRGNFYDAEGKSVKRGFLAAPLRYTRVSSNFSSYRLHPLFGDPRAHRWRGLCSAHRYTGALSGRRHHCRGGPQRRLWECH